jgi:tetratricopeptide (TPR) repeat protein
MLLAGIDKPVEALESFQSALLIQQALAKDHPEVIEFQRGMATSLNGIGILLSGMNRSDEALDSHKEALAIRQKLADANPDGVEYRSELATSYSNIGILYRANKEPDSALKCYESALLILEKLVRENPRSADYASELGNSLNNLALLDLDAQRYDSARDRFFEAIRWQRNALKANPRHPKYRQFLAMNYKNLLLVAAALHDASLAAEAQKGLDELQASDPVLQAWDKRLAEVLQGKTPKGNAERLVLAKRAYDTKRYQVAVKFWADAMAADPQVAIQRQGFPRYNAACAAALVASGLDRDDPNPDDATRSRLRAQARDWLQGELDTWRGLGDDLKSRPEIVRQLKHWQEDADLVGIRDDKALNLLPETERSAWRALWENVARLLSRLESEPVKSQPTAPSQPASEKNPPIPPPS